MALTAAEGRRMVDAAERAGVKLMVAYMTLFNPSYRMAKRIVDAGMLGEIVSVRARHSYTIAPDSISSAAAWRLDPRHGGGPLMDVGVYPTFTLRDLTGMRTTELSAIGTTRRLHGKTEHDSIIFNFLLEDGTPGVIEAAFTFVSSTVELEGTRGRLTLEGHVTQATRGRLDVELWLSHPRKPSERLTHEIDPAGLPEFYNYLAEVEHFAGCILRDEEPISAGRKAVADLQVTDAVRESLRGGARVHLASFAPDR
jgi:predicted dehydrogenase